MHFIHVLFIRIFIALTTRTVFQPDEYFQSLEPAYHSVFGHGNLTWEWRSSQPIRTFLYPAINVPVYWLIKTTGWRWLLIPGPKILHGALASLTDIGLALLTRQTLGNRYVETALFVSLTSFFHSLSLSRSLSNSLETSLTSLAFAHFPWELTYDRSTARKTLVFAALACSIRPTNAIIWVYLFTIMAYHLRHEQRALNALALDIVGIAIVTLLVLLTSDSLYYGKPTFTPWNFFITNTSGLSLFYGSSPWHYYLTQAIPILSASSLPFLAHGIWLAKTKPALARSNMIGTIAFTLFVYSLAGHKEWRFVHPILPLIHVFATHSLVELGNVTSAKDKKKPSKPTQARYLSLPIRKKHFYFICATLPISVYTTLFYCDAPISVMKYIRGLPAEDLRRSVGFLMPCHSTPGHAYLHREELWDGKLWSLGCEPPLNVDISTYHDQTEVFFSFPRQYLMMFFPPEVNTTFPPSLLPASIPGQVHDPERPYPWRHEWPLHLVFFGALLEQDGVQTLLEEKGYNEVHAFGRSWEGDDFKRKGGVRVWKHDIG